MNVLRAWLVSVFLFPVTYIPLADELRDTPVKEQPAVLSQEILARLEKIGWEALPGEDEPMCPDPRRCGPAVVRVGVAPAPQLLVRGWARLLAEGEPDLRLTYQSPWENSGALSADQLQRKLEQFTRTLQKELRAADAWINELQDALANLGSFSTDHVSFPADRETQAKCDYVCAHLAARLALLHEYNALLDYMCKEFPALDSELHKGWRLAPVERFSDGDAKRFAQRARVFLERLAKRGAGTEWEKIASAELALLGGGFEWQPVPRK
jgi:hypothetical protein